MSRVERGRKTGSKRGRTWVSEQQEERRYQVTSYHTYLASGGRLSYSPSVERVDGSITSCSRDEMYQALPALPYCKQRKAGRGTGNEAMLALLQAVRWE